MVRFSVTRGTGSKSYVVIMEQSFITGDNGGLLIDIEVSKWESEDLTATFHYSSYRFRFSLSEPELKTIKTKLLLGIKVRLTIVATYNSQW